MATTRDIKRKVSSIANTQKITGAMKMIASVKLRHANNAVLRMRPYADAVSDIVGKLSSSFSFSDNPLLTLREEKRTEIILITSNKGLCGASNHNVIVAAEKMMRLKSKKGIDVQTSIIGRVGIRYAHFYNWNIEDEYPGILEKHILFSDAKIVSDKVIKRFMDGGIDAAYLIFERFVSVLSQKVTKIQIIPIGKLPDKQSFNTQYILEPEKEELLKTLLPKLIYSEVYRSFLEAAASEQAARMKAMDAATKNAAEMIQRLTIAFNKARQAQITRELIEISSAIEAMK